MDDGNVQPSLQKILPSFQEEVKEINYNSLAWGYEGSLIHTGNWQAFCLLSLRSLSIKLIVKYTKQTDSKITGSADMYRIEKAINCTKDTFLVNICKKSLFQ